MANGSVTASIFVPLLVLVVVEISQTGRELDLREIASRKQEPFFYSIVYILDRAPQDIIRIPQLGTFNFIHGMNLGILYLGYILTITTSSGRTRVLTGLVVFLVLVLFPMIEVNEYVQIMDDAATRPVSFLFHSVLTTVAAGLIFIYEYLVNMQFSVTNPRFDLLGFIILIVMIYYASLIGFLNLLERELEILDSDLPLTHPGA